MFLGGDKMFYNDEDLKVKDLKVGDKGIFYYMNEKNPLIFADLMDINLMDISFIGLYGERRISPFIKSIVKDREIDADVLQEIGDVVIGLFYNKWENLYNVFIQDVELETYNLKTTETITDDGTGSYETINQTSDTDTTGVTGYNTDDYVPDDKQEKERNETITNISNNTNTREKITETKGNINNSINDRIKIIEYLKNNLIYDIIFVDIGQLVGLQIY